MARRSLSIRILLVLCLLFGTCAFSKKKPPAKPVNSNTASSEEPELLPGIGPATVEKILQMRKSYGAVQSLDDLLAIRSLGPKRIEKMRKCLTVRKPATAKPAAPAVKSTPLAE
jgi:competence protein ComEA